MLSQLLVQIINGIIIGSIYSLMALGLNLIWSIVDIPDFSQGSIYVIAAYCSYFAVTLLKVPFLIAMLLGMLIGAILSFTFERFLYRRWRGQGRVQLLSAIALFFLLVNMANLLWTGKARIFPSYIHGKIDFMGYGFGLDRIVTFIASVILFTATYIFIMKTKVGKAVRASSQNMEAASIVGININSVISAVFIIGGALSGAAGTLVAPLYSVFPSMGNIPLLLALVIVIMGGFGTVAGVLVSGIGLGVVMSLGSVYVSSAYQNGFAFIVLVLVLTFFPKGFFGKM